MTKKLAIGIFIIYFVGCSPIFRHNLLTTFFDGVPELDTAQVTVAIDTINQNDGYQKVTSAEIASRPLKAQYIIHSPYLEKKCGNCHDQNRMGSFVDSQPDLCLQCHENMGEKKDFSHGPAAGGYCTSCHDPHKSEVDNLLVRSDQQLCLHCHESGMISKSEIHKDIGETKCTECHNPHSSDNRFMLADGLCTKCHEDFRETYSYTHGPVAGQYCGMCHDAHLAKTDDLLIRPNEELCLHCHDTNQVYKSDYHRDTEKGNCTKCHNPHGGEDKHMLITLK